MAQSREIRNVAIVGTGVIGASWAALYLARGLNVTATDPAPDAEANLRRYIDAAWKDLTIIGLEEGARGCRPCAGERTRTEGFQDQALRRHRCSDSAGCDHRFEFIRTDHEYDAIRL